MRFGTSIRHTSAALLVLLFATQPAWGWGRDGHKLVNRLAVQFLPADVPAFLRNGHAVDVIEYLGPEPDRWHNNAEKQLKEDESPDHFFNMEDVDLVGTLPRTREEYIAAVEKIAVTHPKLTASKLGMQPYAVQDAWQRLKVDFREYRKLVAANTDTSGAQTAILYDAAILGHYVGDGSQPLHTTTQYNGWNGPNPNGYTVAHKIHSLFESTFVSNDIHREDVAALVAATKPVQIDDEWAQYLSYLQQTRSHVEEVYQLEKAKGFDGAGTPASIGFTQQRLAAGVIELRDLIYSAWVHSADPIEEYRGPA
jgi:hypothetical protein